MFPVGNELRHTADAVDSAIDAASYLTEPRRQHQVALCIPGTLYCWIPYHDQNVPQYIEWNSRYMVPGMIRSNVFFPPYPDILFFNAGPVNKSFDLSKSCKYRLRFFVYRYWTRPNPNTLSIDRQHEHITNQRREGKTYGYVKTTVKTNKTLQPGIR